MLRRYPFQRSHLVLWVIVLGSLGGCFSSRGISEISFHPYPLVYEDDSTAKFGDPDDNVFIEVRRTPVSGPVDSLVIHYPSLFPGGETVRAGDNEEYVDLNGRKALKVVFRTKYLRKRKRAEEKPEGSLRAIPPGWRATTIEDPVTGKPISVIQGPVIPSAKTLYLVQGDSYVYYIAMRADGEHIEPARKKLEKFVREDIKYL